ncbi:cation transporter [Puia sp. P3]|uniref:cation transporter n=1 Tax=Puia sp. P3 TaxID=3423952 RepID=UPI003D6640DE
MSSAILDKPHLGTVKSKKNSLVKETFPVLEMTCAACAISVESMLKSVAGVEDAGVNFANQTAWVQYDDTRVIPEKLQSTIRSIGYDLVIDRENQDQVKEEARHRHYEEVKQRTLWSSILSVPIVAIGMFFMNIPYANWIMMALATPVVFFLAVAFL